MISSGEARRFAPRQRDLDKVSRDFKLEHAGLKTFNGAVCNAELMCAHNEPQDHCIGIKQQHIFRCPNSDCGAHVESETCTKALPDNKYCQYDRVADCECLITP
ncbi:hypothetical protein PCANC_12248 [Puccinia coronata f. sp. avenae]|uniref:Uncharacterized protein n=1 Tax=Puccinia coronata f. sp. avenae TaxID=200324 RepID=A0A2N5UAA9_9BASI|nr:hypothetical protein PCANC_12248 [Puccinia coronata f. sp. avenae]